jgi:hypothetical protein
LPAFCQTHNIVFNPTNLRSIYIEDWKICHHDSTSFALKNYNDSHWICGSLKDVNNNKSSIGWLRTQISISEPYEANDNIVIKIRNLPGAFEVFWDGKMLGRNGIIGNSTDSEIPGNTIVNIDIKRDSSFIGTHTLAVRYSNFHNILLAGKIRVIFGYEKIMISSINTSLNSWFFFFGVCIFGVVFCLMLFFSNVRNRLYGLLFIIYLITCIQIIVLIVFSEKPIPFLLYNSLMIVLECTSLILYFFQIFFMLYLYELKLKRVLIFTMFLLIIFGIILKYYISNVFVYFNDFVVICFVITISIVAIIRNIIAGKVMLPIFLFGLLTAFYNLLSSVSIVPIVVSPSLLASGYALVLNAGLIVVIGFKIRIQTKNNHLNELRAKQLEIELLKKSIQPHFIMNTLTSVKSLYHEKPEKAETLIDLLAEEFRLINRISPLKEIPISQEIDLCKFHLEIMNIRLEARYKLLTTDILQSDKIPPLLFHTLIENGITHGNQSERESIFHLSGSYEGNRTVYTLSNSIPTAHQTAGVSENIKEGIGLKYVKTRLEELYPGRWKLDVSIIDDQWQVTITLWKKEI